MTLFEYRVLRFLSCLSISNIIGRFCIFFWTEMQSFQANSQWINQVPRIDSETTVNLLSPMQVVANLLKKASLIYGKQRLCLRIVANKCFGWFAFDFLCSFSVFYEIIAMEYMEMMKLKQYQYSTYYFSSFTSHKTNIFSKSVPKICQVGKVKLMMSQN